MGYDSYMSGEITIAPPLTWAEYQKLDRYRATKHGGDDQTWLHLPLREEPVETEDGTLARKFADTIEPRTDDAVRRAEQGMLDDLQALVDLFGADHHLGGILLRVGVQQGDVQRYWVGNLGKVETQKAEPMVWPNGELVGEV